MPDRLSALDASFLYMDQPTTPMHVGSVSLFRQPRSGFDYDGLVDLISSRIGLVPRYRQKIREVPGGWRGRCGSTTSTSTSPTTSAAPRCPLRAPNGR